METGKKINRRQRKPRALRLSRPLFLQVSRLTAQIVVSASALLLLAVSHFLFPAISLGAIFLLICAFGAWFVGNRFAVLLGTLIVCLQMVGGELVNPIYADGNANLSLLIQLGSGLTLVLMLGVARVALEAEWRFARIDPLTGALNRKAFFEAVEEEARQSSMAVLIFADVDGLKKVNDTFGHEKGDEALCDFSRHVRDSIRKGDLFARIGGDEFLVFLNVSDVADANIVAERLNRNLNLRPSEEEVELTCSFGVLALPHGSRHIDAEIRQADSLMYHAKRQRLGLTMGIYQPNDAKVVPFPLHPQSLGSPHAPVRTAPRVKVAIS